MRKIIVDDSSGKQKVRYSPFAIEQKFNLVNLSYTSKRHRRVLVGTAIAFVFLVFIFLHHYPHGEDSGSSKLKDTNRLTTSESIIKSTPNSISKDVPQTDKNLSKESALLKPLGKVETPLDHVPKDPSRKKIAFAISVTSDGPYVDGAAVLGYGIGKAMKQSIYDFDLVAIVHPDVKKARKPLEKSGWRIIERDVPLDIDDIKGDFLREKIRTNGCCGAHELIKLHAWTLVEYHRVVHLDMDSMIIQPMDELFEGEKHIIYTCDYGMMPKGVPACPVQGGFFIVKPSMTEYQELVDVVKEGDYRNGGAWGGTKIGWFWGGMTIQGLLPYFFTQLKDLKESEEVDRCVYNNMFDNPKCKNMDPYMVKNVHFTVCQKPWTCQRHDRNFACNIYHDIWLKLRYELEVEVGGKPDNIPKPACQGGRYHPLSYLEDK